MALVDTTNNALGKLGGAGDQADGSGQVTAAELTANTTNLAKAVNAQYPLVRKKIIKDFAARKTAFLETQKFADLGADLKQYDLDISSITVASTLITITTKEVHGRATNDTVFLANIKQDSDEAVDVERALIESLNGTTQTITITSTTAFTIATAGIDLTWLHEANTGIISYVPEMGPYQYAFKLPTDYFAMVRQTDESPITRSGVKTEYQNKPILNKDGDGFVLLTNFLTNLDRSGAYVEYCIDQEDFALFSPALEECIATLLAAELCPVVGRNLEVRQGLLAEYDRFTVPEAQRNNQSQSNNFSKHVNDFSGGRTRNSFIPRVGSDLGTYLDASGNRRQV